jgi:DNA polymerase I-like protein with 3'-5' exonuclease and polymerase domains
LGKKINYAAIYGMSMENLSKLIFEETGLFDQSYYSALLGAYPLFSLLERYTTHLHKVNYSERVHGVEKDMFLENYFGRIIKIEKEYAILNNYIQSSGVDFVCIVLTKVYKQFDYYYSSYPKNKVLLQNHDSFLLQVENAFIDADEFKELDIIVCSSFLFLNPVMKYGQNWGELK